MNIRMSFAFSLMMVFIVGNALAGADNLTDDFWKQEQDRINSVQQDDFYAYKLQQSQFADNKRDKSLYHNEYWLVNKRQNMWMGVFDGKYLLASKNNGSSEKLNEKKIYQQILRIKSSDKISQFILPLGISKYPQECLSRNDKIVTDNADYTFFYTGCTFATYIDKTNKHEGYFSINVYDKKYDTVISLDLFPYSSSEGIKYLKKSLLVDHEYYSYDLAEGAFKILGTDKIAIADPNSREILPQVQKTDDNGNSVIINGVPVMINDPDGYNPLILKRLPEVVKEN